jgi:hypothetical protein
MTTIAAEYAACCKARHVAFDRIITSNVGKSLHEGIERLRFKK